jgi:hypothetical protein
MTPPDDDKDKFKKEALYDPLVNRSMQDCNLPIDIGDLVLHRHRRHWGVGLVIGTGQYGPISGKQVNVLWGEAPGLPPSPEPDWYAVSDLMIASRGEREMNVKNESCMSGSYERGV